MFKKPVFDMRHTDYPLPMFVSSESSESKFNLKIRDTLPEIIIISSYPPRECGIATYSHDLILALNNKFENSFRITVCAMENNSDKFEYDEEVIYKLDTENSESYKSLNAGINKNSKAEIILVQHEFGFYAGKESEFIQMLKGFRQDIIMVFHTVLPNPDDTLREHVREIALASASIIVMTNTSAGILISDYGINKSDIHVIPHGTHLVTHPDKDKLKAKYGLEGKKVLSTFGLLSSGKNIETTLEALPELVVKHPDLIFLIIGKTHPSVLKKDGEAYLNMLQTMVKTNKLDKYVRFINRFLPLPELLEYLQLTDIYLFTSKDPNQAVSGTFSYAISCACPIVSTPIPHAREVLRDDAGIIIDFEDPKQLRAAVTRLLNDEELRSEISLNGLQRMATTAWENTAIAHAMLFEQYFKDKISLKYRIPETNLVHIRNMSEGSGMLQFSKINQPDPESGYTLDDNARALIAFCQNYELNKNESDLTDIKKYLNFVGYCQQSDGSFQNYTDIKLEFTEQNLSCNLADSNGRAIWALGYVVSLREILPDEITSRASQIFNAALNNVSHFNSTRAMAFIIKGLHYYTLASNSESKVWLIEKLADKLVQMYRHEKDESWHWFEGYLTYANSLMPEALLCAYQTTLNTVYLDIAYESFDFLLKKTFHLKRLNVISNKNWLHKGEILVKLDIGGEQPIDVAYTILALKRFYDVSGDKKYLDIMGNAFEWFLGNNHLHQIVYNPCTGGCYDGLEAGHINLNQGAESAISYLMAKLCMDKYLSDVEVKKELKSQLLID